MTPIAEDAYIPLYNRYSKAPDGFEDWEKDLFYEFTGIAANGFLRDQPLAIPPDADFYWRGTIVTTLNAVLGSVKVQFRDPFGNQLETAPAFELFFNTASTNGGGALSLPKFTEIYCPRNGFVWVDIQEYLGFGPCTVQIVLVGVERRVKE